MKTKSALSYFGSDSEAAPAIGAMFDHCKHVSIPFVGGASIVPHLKARGIVANDKNDLAINFYRVMSTDGEERDWLVSRCENTLSHPSEILAAEELVEKYNNSCAIDRKDLAWAYWAICWIGRKGKGGTSSEGGKPSIRWAANGGNNASRLRSVAKDLVEWKREFERCEWMDVCFRVFIPKIKDHGDGGIYIDAPWVGAGDAYFHSFTEEDHKDLRNSLKRFKESSILVRYGDCEFIRELYKGWTIVDAKTRSQANKSVKEIWIMKNMGSGE